MDNILNQRYYKRFEKAEMVDEYRSIYNSLCSHSHSNVRSLYNRYTHITGNDFKVICCKDPEPPRYHPLFSYAL